MAQSISDMSVTWPDGSTYNGIKLNVNDAGPSSASSLLMDLQVGSASRFSVGKAGVVVATGIQDNITSGSANFALYNDGLDIRSSSRIRWSSSATIAGMDLVLARDAANTLAQRNGVNGQTFRLYGTYTDATIAFERFFIEAPSAAGATVLLGTQKGTGASARALAFQTDGTTRLTIGATGQVNVANPLAVNGVPVINGSGSTSYLCNGSYATTNGISFNTASFGIRNNVSLGWYDSDPNGTLDLSLFRDAANTLAQRNSTNAQESRIYGSYTSATKYQRMSV